MSSWASAFSAAASVRPAELDEDFLRRTAPRVEEEGRGDCGAPGGGLSAVAALAKVASKASASSSVAADASAEADVGRGETGESPSPSSRKKEKKDKKKDKKAKKKNKKKKDEDKKGKKKKRDETNDDYSSNSESNVERGASSARKRRRSDGGNNGGGYAPKNDEGGGEPSSPVLEGRMVPHPGRRGGPSEVVDSVMVLVDRENGLAYSGVDMGEDGSRCVVGRLNPDGEVVLDEGLFPEDNNRGGDEEEKNESTKGTASLGCMTGIAHTEKRKKDTSGDDKLKPESIRHDQTSDLVLPDKADFPYPTESDDHCESPLESYEDAAPLLTALRDILKREKVGLHKLSKKKRRTDKLGDDDEGLAIYDPYYCDGSVVSRLGSLGFDRVYNRKEDCYAVWSSSSSYPKCDVLVTNPPYSADHIDRLMAHVTSSTFGTRPWLLLMPNFVHKKECYTDALDAANGGRGIRPFYVVPRKRYVYLPPKNFREKKVSDVHRKSSPFVSMWYVWGGTADRTEELIRRWHGGGTSTGEDDCVVLERTRGRCDLARSKSALRDLRRKSSGKRGDKDEGQKKKKRRRK
mmetsp:Transcript_25844/g.76383  ORF Transcript_25844/g.76383 Transcript_25844/m.76383 type:complete len:576 (-) Transcript_25844:691-2418(-)